MPKLTQDEIVSRLKEDIEAAERVRDTESVSNREIYEYYRAKKMGDEIQGRSQIVDTTVFETVEWILPALMDIFSQENGIPIFNPVGPEDVESADKMTEVSRYQFWRQNDGEEILYDAIKDALLYRPGGIIKWRWEKVVATKKKSLTGVTQDQLFALTASPNVTVQKTEPAEVGFNVDVVLRSTEFDGPVFEVVPPHEFLRHPNARSIKKSPFVAHKKRVTLDFLRKQGQAGFFENVEKAIDENQGGTAFPDQAEEVTFSTDKLSREEEPSGDKARREVDLYECYTRIDTDGDGILENRIVWLVGSVILRNKDNLYGRPPFALLRGIKDTHKIAGITLTEMVQDIQRLRTFLMRQMVDNMAQANNSRKVYDPTKLNQADLLNNIPGAPIRVKSGIRPTDAIFELPTQPFNPVTFTVLEYATSLAEQRTGVTKSSKGVGDQYQQTATGQLSAINQASMRVRQIAKVLSFGLKDLFHGLVTMNKEFLTQDVVMRLTDGAWLKIAPDDLEGKMDLELNVIMGGASRQQEIVYMQQLLAVYGQLVMAGIPALDANNTPNIMRDIVKAMGKKNQNMYLPLIFQQEPRKGNQSLAALQTMNAMMGGENGGNGGGATVGSIAGTGAGGTGTTNPTGAGVQQAFIQPGAGGGVPGFGGPMPQ